MSDEERIARATRTAGYLARAGVSVEQYAARLGKPDAEVAAKLLACAPLGSLDLAVACELCIGHSYPVTVEDLLGLPAGGLRSAAGDLYSVTDRRPPFS